MSCKGRGRGAQQRGVACDVRLRLRQRRRERRALRVELCNGGGVTRDRRIALGRGLGEVGGQLGLEHLLAADGLLHRLHRGVVGGVQRRRFGSVGPQGELQCRVAGCFGRMQTVHELLRRRRRVRTRIGRP